MILLSLAARNQRTRHLLSPSSDKQGVDTRGALSEVSMSALRRGWYLGDENFRDGMMDSKQLKGQKGQKQAAKGS